MSLAWGRTHRRHDLVHAVLGEVARTGSPDVAAALRQEIDDAFGDFATFLVDVRRRWYQTFDARLDALLANRPAHFDAAVRDLWRDLDEEQPATRLLLDGHEAELAAIDAHQSAALRTATGVDHATRRVS
jgi:hypothetical protein